VEVNAEAVEEGMEEVDNNKVNMEVMHSYKMSEYYS
jgi:hypothetical protein